MPGVETKDTRWPRDARRSASSRYGSRCPNASHGKITMRSGRWQSAAWTEQAAELDGDAAGGAGGGQLHELELILRGAGLGEAFAGRPAGVGLIFEPSKFAAHLPNGEIGVSFEDLGWRCFEIFFFRGSVLNLERMSGTTVIL